MPCDADVAPRGWQVLDRLNPLLEPGGELMINERGLVGGRPYSARAHPGFRLFLAMDPRLGEVSRAMRNRGLEIYLAPLGATPTAADEQDAKVGDDSALQRMQHDSWFEMRDRMY